MGKSTELCGEPFANGPVIESKNILILQDVAGLTEELAMLLAMQNYYVKAVHRGVHGLQEVMARDFDVIVCDMEMRGLPGDMFYLAVQKLKPKLCTRFLFITEDRGSAGLSSFVEKTSQPVLYKPLTLDILLNAILRSLLQQDVERRSQLFCPDQRSRTELRDRAVRSTTPSRRESEELPRPEPMRVVNLPVAT